MSRAPSFSLSITLQAVAFHENLKHSKDDRAPNKLSLHRKTCKCLAPTTVHGATIFVKDNVENN
jgi:hypothetical protein